MKGVWFKSFAVAVELAALMILVPVVNAPPVLAQGGLAPGLYVTSLRTEPAQPTPNVPISFYATFLNNSGPYSNVRWVVYIYLPGDFRHSIGETSKDASFDIPVGTTELQALGAWKIGVGDPCRFYTARVAWLDNNNKAAPYQKPDGSTADFPLTVCDFWPTATPNVPQVAAPPPAPPAPPTQLPVATAALPAATGQAAGLSPLAPPLADLDFSAQVFAYPPEWPAELRFPGLFQLVDANTQVTTQDNLKGWGAKLLFAGTPADASSRLESFFGASGWTVSYRLNLDAGGILLLIERGSQPQTGIVVIDPDLGNNGNARILATIFL